MDSDLLLEITKYLDSPLRLPQIERSGHLSEFFTIKKNYIKQLLENKLTNRPTYQELKERNIIKSRPCSFFGIHELLKKITVSRETKRIAPSIENLARKLEFKLRRRFLIFKLGIEDQEIRYMSYY